MGVGRTIPAQLGEASGQGLLGLIFTCLERQPPGSKTFSYCPGVMSPTTIHFIELGTSFGALGMPLIAFSTSPHLEESH